MRKRKHYLAVIATWVDVNMEFQELCLGVVVVDAPRDGAKYQAAFETIMAFVVVGTEFGRSDMRCERSQFHQSHLLSISLLEQNVAHSFKHFH